MLTVNTPIELFPDTSIDGVPVAPTGPVEPFRYTPMLFVSPVPVNFIIPVFSILALFTPTTPIPFDIVLFAVVVIVPVLVSLAPFANIPIAKLPSSEIVPLFITVALLVPPFPVPASALIPTFTAWLWAILGIVELIFIFPLVSFVISLSMLINVPEEFCTSVRFIVPVFFAFPESKLTFLVTLVSSINAIAAELSALSNPFGFFLRLIVPAFSISALGAVREAIFIP